MTATMPVSNDPSFTVSPEILVSNMIVGGGLPPVLNHRDVQNFIEHHGEAYGKAAIDQLVRLGFKIAVDA